MAARKPKYPPRSLIFTEGNHQYRFDGKRIRGVTTLIKNGWPKDALVKWAPRVVAEWVADHPEELQDWYGAGDRDALVKFLKDLPDNMKRDKGIKGTVVHKLAENLVYGHEVDVPEDLLPMVENYARFLDAWQVESLLTERSVANETHWYAGRFDGVFRIPKLGDGLALVDNKTSNNLYGETAMQTGAYARAEFYVNEGAPDVLLPLPEGIVRTVGIHITPDATTLHVLSKSPAEIDRAFDCFLKAAAVSKVRSEVDGTYDYKTRERKGGMVGPALNPDDYELEVAS